MEEDQDCGLFEARSKAREQGQTEVRAATEMMRRGVQGKKSEARRER